MLRKQRIHQTQHAPSRQQQKQRGDTITWKTDANATTSHNLVKAVVHHRETDFKKNLKQNYYFCFEQTAPPSKVQPCLLVFATARRL